MKLFVFKDQNLKTKSFGRSAVESLKLLSAAQIDAHPIYEILIIILNKDCFSRKA